MRCICALILTMCFIVANFSAVSQTHSSARQASIDKADSLFLSGQWEKARAIYEANSRDHSDKFKALTWNRLGYCYHNLGNYPEALKNYKKAMASGPSAPLKPYLTSRMARAYAMQQNKDEAFAWLDSAALTGYANLNEVDTLSDFNSLRKDSRFQVYRQKVFANAYPCTGNPRNHDFDFWIGEWDVYQTGTTSPIVGYSVIQSISGGCAVLENWTSRRAAHEGKSINYFDQASGKWEQDWMGSDGGATRFTNGEYKDGAMRFIFEAPLANGEKGMGRFIFFNLGSDRVRQFSEQSANGTDWQTNYDFTYVRRKKVDH